MLKCPSERPALRSGTRYPRPPEAAGWRPRSLCRLLGGRRVTSTPSVIVNRVCLAGAGYARCSRRRPVEKDGVGANLDSWRRSSTRRLDRRTRWSGCSTSWTAGISRGGCCVAGGRTLSLLPAPYLAGRCSSDGRPLRVMWLTVRPWRMCSVFVHWRRRWSAS